MISNNLLRSSDCRYHQWNQMGYVQFLSKLGLHPLELMHHGGLICGYYGQITLNRPELIQHLTQLCLKKMYHLIRSKFYLHWILEPHIFVHHKLPLRELTSHLISRQHYKYLNGKYFHRRSHKGNDLLGVYDSIDHLGVPDSQKQYYPFLHIHLTFWRMEVTFFLHKISLRFRFDDYKA